MDKITIETLRQYKIFGYAIFDLTVTFMGIYLLSPLLSKLFLLFKVDVPKMNWMFLALPIGILVHIAIGNMTPMTKNLLDPHSNYVLKVIILGLLVFGLKGVKIVR